MRLFLPADAPVWLTVFARSIEDMFRSILSAPLRLMGLDSAELPEPADFSQGLVYDLATAEIVYSTGSEWRRLFGSGNAMLGAISALVPSADSYLYFTGPDSAALGAITPLGRSLVESGDAEAARAAIGAADAAALDSKLDSSLVSAFGLTLIDDANAAGARSTLGLAAIAATGSPTDLVGSIPLSKLASISSQTFLGRTSAGGGAVETLTVSQAKTMLNLAGTNSGDQIITLTGDVTGSGTGSFAATIAAGAVGNSKLASMAASTFKGRSAASAGAPENLDVTQVKSMLNLFGSNSGDQTITLTGDVTGSGMASFPATIAANAVSLAKMAQVATQTFLGRTTAGTGNVEALSIAQAKSLLSLSGTNNGDQTITLTGDVTGSGTGSFAATIAGGSVTLAKMGHVTPPVFLGRTTAGTGVVEALSAAQAKTMLNLAGTNSGDQTITLTGDVTGTGTGSFAATIGNAKVTNSKLASMDTATIKGRMAGLGAPQDLTIEQVRSLLGHPMSARQLESGRFFPSASHGMGTTQTMVVVTDRIIAIPYYMGVGVDGIAIEVVTGAAGSSVRLGIYGADSRGAPASLLADGGTIATDTAGVKICAVTSMAIRTPVWLTAHFSGTPTIRAQLPSALGNAQFGYATFSTASSDTYTYVYQDKPFGPFASYWGGTILGGGVLTNLVPHIALRGS